MDELVRKTDELTDIVKRLLEGADYAWDTEAMTAAAAEITALRAENERLRAALRLIADDVGAGTWQGNHARAALEEKP